MPEDPADSRFSKKVDEDWKKSARAEKDKLAADQKQKEASGDAESDETFLRFVSSLIGQVQMDLGLIEHPMTGQREMNLEQARYMIDVISVLDKKTKASQSAEEKNFFSRVLQELRMVYVQVAQQGGGGGGAAPDGAAPAPAPKGRGK
jgi:hypothetical protein